MARYSRALLHTAVLLAAALPAAGQELPEGKGKDLVAAQCNSCHPFFARIGGGYTPEGWRTVMRMMTNHGVAIPPDQLATMTDYLSRNFPEKPKPAGVVLAGPVKVTMTSWTVPPTGSSRTRTATSGTRATPARWSASWIRAPAPSPSTRCRTPACRTRTR